MLTKRFSGITWYVLQLQLVSILNLGVLVYNSWLIFGIWTYSKKFCHPTYIYVSSLVAQTHISARLFSRLKRSAWIVSKIILIHNGVVSNYTCWLPSTQQRSPAHHWSVAYYGQFVLTFGHILYATSPCGFLQTNS